MMKKYFCIAVFSAFSAAFSAQSVGINTAKPDPSAILEVSANPAPNSSKTTKEGLLLPRVSLTGTTDVTTIPSPARGLIVYNLANAGTTPNNVIANSFYYFNGTKWTTITVKPQIEASVMPHIFYIEGKDTQEFTKEVMNSPVGSPKVVPSPQLVTFSGTPVLNSGNNFTFNDSTDTFTVNTTGLYGISGFVNYNPMNKNLDTSKPSGNQRAFLNLKFQISTDNGKSWADLTGTRTAWGNGAAGYLKTVKILSVPYNLTKGNMLRLMISNPFGSEANDDHCNDGRCYIGTSTHVPLSKVVRIQLFDFNFQ